MVRANAQNSDINISITSRQASIKLAAIGQGDANAPGVLNNMSIGEDLTI
jgi:hypothetical protein